MYNRVKKEKIEELKELAKVDLLKSIYKSPNDEIGFQNETVQKFV